MHQFHKFIVMKIYMFRKVRLSIIRSLFTVHSAMVYVEQEHWATLYICFIGVKHVLSIFLFSF
jgi:hypothetical protein